MRLPLLFAAPLLPLALALALSDSACVPRKSGANVPVGRAVAAPPEPVKPGTPSPVHAPSEVTPPPVVTMSAPLPGFQRGINFGNALDAPREGAWGVTISETHFEMAKQAGLDHVRLPVCFSAHAADEAPYTIAPALFDRIDWVLEQAQSRGLSVILDLHHYRELMKKPKEHGDRLVALWKQIGARFKHAPPSVAFELINEPCDELKPDILNPLTRRALAAVRAENPTRTVIVDSYFWAAADRLKELDLPQDPNLVASFHMYQPILFTHQGAQFMGPEYQTRGVVFPGPPQAPLSPVAAALETPWAKEWFAGYNAAPVGENPNGPKAIFDYFKIVEDYVAATGRRVYLGEFGVSVVADPKSRTNWIRLVRKEAERRRIGWAIWDDGGAFRAMEVKYGDWVAPIHAGLFQ
jgi:endoglucanase